MPRDRSLSLPVLFVERKNTSNFYEQGKKITENSSFFFCHLLWKWRENNRNSATSVSRVKQHIVLVAWHASYELETIPMPMITFPNYFANEQMKINNSTPLMLGPETGFQHKCFTGTNNSLNHHLLGQSWNPIKIQQTRTHHFHLIVFLFSTHKAKGFTKATQPISQTMTEVRLIRRLYLAKWRAFKVGASSSFIYSGLTTGDYRKDTQAGYRGDALLR